MTQKEEKLYKLLGDSIEGIVDKSPKDFNTFKDIYNSGYDRGKVLTCLIVQKYLSGNIDSKEFVKLMIKS